MNKITMILGAALMLGLVSCKKSEFEGYATAENGVEYKYYTVDEKGTKASAEDGISIRIVYALKGKDGKADSVLFDSKMASRDGSGIINHILPKSNYRGSLEDALTMMSKNDSASFIINADSFFLKANKLNELPPYIKPGDKLEVFVKMVDVKLKKELDDNRRKQEEEMAAMQKEELVQLAKYVADNKITAQPTASGLYVIETKKGSAVKAKPGDKVKVNYVGRLLDGTVFDTSLEAEAKTANVYNPNRPYEPLEFSIEQGEVIRGWDEAFQLIGKGGKAKILVPSGIGYGPMGNGPIPPFATLIFDVELVDVIPAK